MIIKTGNYALQEYPFINLEKISFLKGINAEFFIVYDNTKYEINIYPYGTPIKCNYIILIRKMITKKFARNYFSGQKTMENIKYTTNIVCSNVDNFLDTVDLILNDFEQFLSRGDPSKLRIIDNNAITSGYSIQEFQDRFPEFLQYL